MGWWINKQMHHSFLWSLQIVTGGAGFLCQFICFLFPNLNGWFFSSSVSSSFFRRLHTNQTICLCLGIRLMYCPLIGLLIFSCLLCFEIQLNSADSTKSDMYSSFSLVQFYQHGPQKSKAVGTKCEHIFSRRLKYLCCSTSEEHLWFHLWTISLY